MRFSWRKIAVFTTLFVSIFIFMWVLTGRWMSEGQEPKADGTHEYAIILGAKVNGEIPSLSLRYRLDAALAYAYEFPNVKFILSGGQGAGEFITEAEAMRQFLVEHGVEEGRLLVEETSTSTYENILYSKEMMPSSVKGVTIVTSDYHLARARKIAEMLELETDVVAAKTPKVVEVKLRMRERLALIKTILVGK